MMQIQSCQEKTLQLGGQGALFADAGKTPASVIMRIWGNDCMMRNREKKSERWPDLIAQSRPWVGSARGSFCRASTDEVGLAVLEIDQPIGKPFSGKGSTDLERGEMHRFVA